MQTEKLSAWSSRAFPYSTTGYFFVHRVTGFYIKKPLVWRLYVAQSRKEKTRMPYEINRDCRWIGWYGNTDAIASEAGNGVDAQDAGKKLMIHSRQNACQRWRCSACFFIFCIEIALYDIFCLMICDIVLITKDYLGLSYLPAKKSEV